MFPKNLHHKLTELKNEIASVEAKIEKSKEVNGKKNLLKEKGNNKNKIKLQNSCRRAAEPKKNVCALQCNCIHDTKTGVGNVVTKIQDINHVHHTIRIPNNFALITKRPEDSNKTWSDIFQQNKCEEIHTSKKNNALKSHSNRGVTEEALSMIQKTIRDAKAEKEAAQLEAARQSMAVDKLKVILETNAAVVRHNAQEIEAIEQLIEERLAAERREVTGLQILSALQNLHSSASSRATSPEQISFMPSINTSSPAFRHSSPSKSKASLADADEESWNEISSIQGLSFHSIS